MIQLAIPLEQRREVVVPDASTQCGVLLRAFQRGERLTIWNAMTVYGIGALHQRVKDLRNMGWRVHRGEIVRNGKRFAEFWMEHEQERMAA